MFLKQVGNIPTFHLLLRTLCSLILFSLLLEFRSLSYSRKNLETLSLLEYSEV